MKSQKKIDQQKENSTKKYPPINGSAIEQSFSNSVIARKIGMYLNTCNLMMEEDGHMKLEGLDKTSLGDIIFTLQVEENTQKEMISYFRKYFKIELYPM